MEKLITKTTETANAMPESKPEPPKASPQTAAIINKAEAKEDAERAAARKSAPAIKFGVLKEVPIDEVWNADNDFADWFAENVAMLDAAIGMTFNEVQKIGKGDFTATAGKKTILIEMQLGQTNHHNLGRLLVHATEHAANVAVWVVAIARSEHKATVRWMNANGNAIYLVELHSYKVGDSMMAANFEVIEKP